MTLLSVLRRPALLAGLTAPTSAASTSDPLVAQLAEIARVEAEELAARVDWSGIVRTHSFTCVNGVAQPNGLPDDFGRFTFACQVWNGGLNRPIAGPADSSSWAGSLVWANPAVAQRFRIVGGQFEMLGARAGDVVSYPYVTSKIYRDANGVPSAEWSGDAFTCRISERLISLGVLWRWKQAKGFDYAEDLRSSEREVERAASADGGGLGVVSLSAPHTRDLPDACQTYAGVLGP